MGSTDARGWGRPMRGKRWHYFDRGYSLCTNWRTSDLDKLIPGPTSGTSDDCVTCSIRYERGLYEEDDSLVPFNAENISLEDTFVAAVSNRAPAKTKKGPPPQSKFRGVSSHMNGKWQANLKVRGTPLYLGLYKSEEEAARAYDDAVKKHLGPDGYERLNFKEEAPAN